MKFNWNSVHVIDDRVKKYCIELEYKLRPRITHFLMAHMEKECSGDFSCFHFDVDLEKLYVTIARPTPLEFKRKIVNEFDREINQNFTNHLLPHLRTA